MFQIIFLIIFWLAYGAACSYFMSYLYDAFKSYGNKWWALFSVPINLMFSIFIQYVILTAFPIMKV